MKPTINELRFALRRWFDLYAEAQEVSDHDKGCLNTIQAILSALDPPNTIEACEAVIGEPQQGSTFRYMEYLPNAFEFRVLTLPEQHGHPAFAEDHLATAQAAWINKQIEELRG